MRFTLTLYNRDDNFRTQTLRINLDFDFPCCQNTLPASKCSVISQMEGRGGVVLFLHLM